MKSVWVLCLLAVVVCREAHGHTDPDSHEVDGETPSKYHHRCIHDTVKMTDVPSIAVNYGHELHTVVGVDGSLSFHPKHEARTFEQTAVNQTFKNLRIKYFFDVDGNGKCSNASQTVTTFQGQTVQCTDNDILTDAKRDYILNVLMPRSSSFLQSALNVVRVSGNLTISGSRCGSTPGIIVPSSHRQGGVSDADFIIYVTANPLQNPLSQTVAWATTCFKDQVGRPIAGQINFVPKSLTNAVALKSSIADLDVNTATHEFCHALGFNSPFFSSGYVNMSGVRQPAATASTQGYNAVLGKTTTMITTPRVLREARAYFGCDTLAGVEIEDQGGVGTQGSHWEKRILYQEFIAGVLCTSQTFISTITLAYFEDTGFYTANYDVAQNDKMNWGKNKSCSFLTQRCNSTDNSNGGEYCFDADTTRKRCTFDRTAGGYCGVSTYSSALPVSYRYFSSPFVGSDVAVADYCPAVLPYSNLVCIEPTNADAQDIYGNMYSTSSRCFESNLIQSDFDVPSIDVRCFQYSCSIVTGALLVNVRGQTVRCPSNRLAGYADTSNLRGFHGQVLCPPAADLCPNPNAPTPAPTPAPTTNAPTPAPPGYTSAPAPVSHSAKVWYNFNMPTGCDNRSACAARIQSSSPACRVIAKRLVDCYGTDCGSNIVQWLTEKGFTDKCNNDMASLAAACQESWQGAGAICTLATGGSAISAALSLFVMLVVTLATMLMF